MVEPKYPEIVINLSGEDGNAFFILGRCSQAMKRAGIPMEIQGDFMLQAKSGDYDHLLRTVMKYFSVK